MTKCLKLLVYIFGPLLKTIQLKIRESKDAISRRTIDVASFTLSVGVRGNAYLLEIEGLFTRRSRPGRTVGKPVGGIFQMESCEWSSGIRLHNFDTRPDTEFNSRILS
jgi:hypothetical protein